MGYPRRLLGADEEIVLELHPHGKALVRPALVLVVTAALVGYLDAVLPAGGYRLYARWAVVTFGVLVVLRWSVLPWLRWLTTLFVFTTERVVIRAGVLARSGRDIRLDRINDVTFEHSFFERLLGCGTLIVESGGERGQVVLRAVPAVERVQRQLYELVDAEDEHRRPRRYDGSAPEPAEP